MTEKTGLISPSLDHCSFTQLSDLISLGIDHYVNCVGLTPLAVIAMLTPH
ncbi:MAG: hypothetical protein GX672_04040 [Synergistaceae bacterium]|nr:hypothetical protein [Synergistaceae bacterium]